MQAEPMKKSATNRPEGLVRPRFAIAMAAVATVCLAMLAYRHFVKEDSLKEAAERCLSAMERGDAKTPLRYMSQPEIEALSLDETKSLPGFAGRANDHDSAAFSIVTWDVWHD